MRGPFGVGNIVPVRIPELAAGVFSFLSLSPRGIFPDRKTPNGAVPTKIPELQRELPCLYQTKLVLRFGLFSLDYASSINEKNRGIMKRT